MIDLRKERRSAPNTGAHARYTVLRVVAAVIIINALVAAYVSIKAGQLDKSLEKMGDMALGAIIGFLARTESPGDLPPADVNVVNPKSDPIPTEEGGGDLGSDASDVALPTGRDG